MAHNDQPSKLKTQWLEHLEEYELSSIRRLVLLSLATWMNPQGHCFPSIKSVAKRAGLNERTVRRHLEDCHKLRLINRNDRRKYGGQGWRRYEYWAEISFKGADPLESARHKKGVDPQYKGAYTERTKVRPPESPLNLKEINYEMSEEKTKKQKQIITNMRSQIAKGPTNE